MPFHYVISQPLMVMELKLFFLFSRDTESISRSSQLAAQRTKTVPVSMASLVSQPRRSVQVYWARRNYRRLRVAHLGGGRKQQQQQPWKRLARAPARLLARLRDAYVDAMLALAGGRRPLARARSCAPEAAGLLLARRARTRGSSDFERRMMEHIYNTVLTPELPCAEAWIVSSAPAHFGPLLMPSLLRARRILFVDFLLLMWVHSQ
jgi:hypothetical protein